MSRSGHPRQGSHKGRSQPAQTLTRRSWLSVALVAILVVGGLAAIFLRPSAAPSARPTQAASAVATGTSGNSIVSSIAAASSAADPSAAQQSGSTQQEKSASQNADRRIVQAEDGVAYLPVADLVGEQANFYTYQAKGKTIPFFVMRSSDGVIRAAFDACDVCFSAKKGYHQEGDEMVCNNCGSRFPSVQINEVQGGCNPSPLDRTVQGDNLIIRVTDLEAGAKYF
jgi:hypothetical protein